MTGHAAFTWLARRWLPIVATVGLAVYAMASTLWWGPHFVGKTQWSLPDDLWGTLVAAQRALHLAWGGLYTEPTGLVTMPGGALILVPVVALIDALGLPLTVQGPHNPYPSAWLVAGPYEIVISGLVLFAADAVAERLGLARSNRLLLTAAEVVALWSVSVQWGHPEDAVAVGLFLYALLMLTGSPQKSARSAWLVGAAVAVQPLVLLALPVALVRVPPRRVVGFVARAATPGGLLLGLAALANWSATFAAVVRQPNQPAVNHPTPWTFLTPRAGHAAVVAGPARVLAILVAAGCAWGYFRARRRRGAGAGASPAELTDLLWWTAVALAVRSYFEPVMVAYYLWPPMAVALLAASPDRRRLVATGAGTTTLTFVALVHSQDPWSWWAPIVGGLALTLLLARRPSRQPGDVAVYEHVADEGADVDQAVRHDEAQQPSLALVQPAEQQAQGAVP